jgi:16S rRNA (adenine1518-N6/adenine1519-N6)-dimethyltransferase
MNRAHRPRKRFGQNFLHDQNVLQRIIAAADICDDDQLMEVGPGPGALTDRLISKGRPLLAIEIDRDLAAALIERNIPQLEVVVGDAIRLDWDSLLTSPPYKLVANLPYNISSQVLFKTLEYRQKFRRLVLMFQKEVGDRLIAERGTRDYGVLSVLMQTWFSIERVIKVPPSCFQPPPKVDSVVLRFDPLQSPVVDLLDENLYRKLVKDSFAQRRKTLRNSLSGCGWDTALLDKAFAETGIDPRRRGETLSIEEFGELANTLIDIGEQ